MIPPTGRAAFTAEHGARSLDRLNIHRACQGCGQHVEDDALRAMGSASYRTLEELVASVAPLVGGMAGTAGSCAECGGELAVVAVDHHSFQTALGCDLVVRFDPVAGTHTLHTWSARGYELLDSFDDDIALGRDAAIRAAEAVIEVSGFEQAIEDIQQAIGAASGHPALMAWVPALMAMGKGSLVGAIVEGRLEAEPGDAAAHYWMGELTFQLVHAGQWEDNFLPMAREHLEEALRLAPDLVEAAITLANVHQFKGEGDKALALFEELAGERPDLALLQYYLGSLKLGADDSAALAHFARGEQLDPEDADYPLGQARALFALDRVEEAAETVERARKLAPDHPLIAEFDNVL